MTAAPKAVFETNNMTIGNNPLINYVKESAVELRNVSWPSRKVVIRDTIVVVTVSVAMAIFFGAADFGLSKGLELVLAKFQ